MLAEDILLCRKSEKKGGFIAYKTDRFIGGKKRTSGSAETKQRSSAALQSRQKPIALKYSKVGRQHCNQNQAKKPAAGPLPQRRTDNQSPRSSVLDFIVILRSAVRYLA